MTHINESKRGKQKRILDIKGDCLEHAGLRIPHGGIAVVCCGERDIKVGDLVHCGRVVGEIPGMIKQVKKIECDSITVGSSYTDASRDFSFVAAEIYGVVLEVYCKLFHNQIYERMPT